MGVLHTHTRSAKQHMSHQHMLICTRHPSTAFMSLLRCRLLGICARRMHTYTHDRMCGSYVCPGHILHSQHNIYTQRAWAHTLVQCPAFDVLSRRAGARCAGLLLLPSPSNQPGRRTVDSRPGHLRLIDPRGLPFFLHGCDAGGLLQARTIVLPGRSRPPPIPRQSVCMCVFVSCMHALSKLLLLASVCVFDIHTAQTYRHVPPCVRVCLCSPPHA